MMINNFGSRYFFNLSKLAKIIVFIFLIIWPTGSKAFKNIIFSAKEYNVGPVVSPGEIISIDKLTIINIGDEVLDTNLFFYLDKNNSNEKFHLWPKELFLEAGKAQQINLNLQLPLNLKAGDYQGQLLVQSKNVVSDVSDNAEATAYINFNVRELSYLGAIWQRALSLWEIKDTTFYLCLVLFFIWLLAALFFIFIKFKNKK